MSKVSVIVPVYGVEDYIIKCMDSIVNQTMRDIEIIVVNDGTKDKSIELIEKKYQDNRIKIYNKKNEGVAKARNFGIKKAKGQYLFFVDSDDFIKNNTIEILYNKAIEQNYDIVLCDYYKYYNKKKYYHFSLIEHYKENNPLSIITAMPGPVCKLIKRNLFIENNITFLENNSFEDNAIMPLVCGLAKSNFYIKQPLYYYRQRNGSSLNKECYDKRWEDIFESLSYLVNKFKEYGLYNKCYSELEYIYIEYLLHASNLRFIDYKEGLKNIKKVSKVIKKEFPRWRNNKYYKEENIKYKIMCNLFYYQKINLIIFIRRKK